jgi:hypothetical protein
MSKISDAADPLDSSRKKVAAAIAEVKAVTGTAGSDEVRAAQCALEYLGYAYSVLSTRAENPAWA